MSSVPEERNFIIQKYIPKLITHLTKFNVSFFFENKENN